MLFFCPFFVGHLIRLLCPARLLHALPTFFARDSQLRSGASPEQVQGVVDDLFGGFYDAGPYSPHQTTDRSRVGTSL